jgi:hypothetical protein
VVGGAVEAIELGGPDTVATAEDEVAAAAEEVVAWVPDPGASVLHETSTAVVTMAIITVGLGERVNVIVYSP